MSNPIGMIHVQTHLSSAVMLAKGIGPPCKSARSEIYLLSAQGRGVMSPYIHSLLPTFGHMHTQTVSHPQLCTCFELIIKPRLFYFILQVHWSLNKI